MSLCIVTPLGGRRALADLDAGQVTASFRRHGFVLFRGFAAGPAELEAFTARFTERYFYGYGRAPFAAHKTITTVNETQLALEPHCDNALRPEEQRPDITWFWCERPPDDAGETTLFDGVPVWCALSVATRDVLATRRISYLTRYAWKQLGLPSYEAFAAFVARSGGSLKRALPDDSAEVEVLAPAVRATRWGGEQAFVSSLFLAGSPGFTGMTVALEGASGFPEDLRRELRATLDGCCQVVSWQAGDVAMLDNTRFLHGRRAFRDLGRRLYLIQTLRASF